MNSQLASRRDELRANLEVVHQRIADAATSAGRQPDEITLIAVTKFFPASDVRLLAELGVSDMGENKHQEAQAKVAEVAEYGDVEVRWHYIGGLQSNKAAQVAGYADAVHSIDRAKLVSKLAHGAEGRAHPLDVLIQVSLDEEAAAGRHGADPTEVAALADLINSQQHLRLRGVMAVAPLGEDPRPAFERLAEISAALVQDHPDATWISAGMSGDLEAAISTGATHVRVGAGILGPRPAIQ